MNVGIVDITATSQCIVLRIRHGHPEAVFAAAEIPALRAAINAAERQHLALAAQPLPAVEDEQLDPDWPSYAIQDDGEDLV